MLEITTAVFLTMMGSALYHLIPERMLRARLGYVAALSFLVVFAYYPVAALMATGSGVFAWLLALLSRRNAAIKKYGPFSLIGLLLVFGYEDVYVATNIFDKTLVQFGLSFYVLRLYLSLRTAAARGYRVGLEEFLTIALFFPIFPAGPICAQEAFSQSATKNRPLLQNYLLGLFRIGIGIFALYFVTRVAGDLTAPLLQLDKKDLVQWYNMGAIDTYLVMILKFIDLYANFAGYTQIAIGLGLFFGFEIPENFRYPFLATNIQNFWQRWHLSLSRFITTQIYLPLMLSLRKPRLSMFLAFTLVGMWHLVSWQYLVWGMGHGAALATYMTLSGSKQYKAIVSRIPVSVWTACGWLVTMSLVAFLSTFANEPSIGQSLVFTRTLIAGW
jgi:D-alanyl-lipoteichoic acid acyltransferase DltB (MBOAT superfamily)